MVTPVTLGTLLWACCSWERDRRHRRILVENEAMEGGEDSWLVATSSAGR